MLTLWKHVLTKLLLLHRSRRIWAGGVWLFSAVANDVSYSSTFVCQLGCNLLVPPWGSRWWVWGRPRRVLSVHIIARWWWNGTDSSSGCSCLRYFRHYVASHCDLSRAARATTGTIDNKGATAGLIGGESMLLEEWARTLLNRWGGCISSSTNHLLSILLLHIIVMISIFNETLFMIYKAF